MYAIAPCTSLQNPAYMKDGFYIRIESLHLADNGTTENVSLVVVLLLELEFPRLKISVLDFVVDPVLLL